MTDNPESRCPQPAPKSACCCGSAPAPQTSAVPPLPPADRRGDLWCRISNNFRMNYTVAPGLYTIGKPDGDSPVLVTANYRMTANCLRKAMEGRSVWVLVIDTKGINVWCAAGKGSFGTKELVNRIGSACLADHVNHRKLILPQLGAPGVAAHEVRKATGFSVVYGPVRAGDIPAFIDAGNKATDTMRTVTFTMRERLVLAPMELLPALRNFLWIMFGCAVVMGMQRTGILYREAVMHSLPIIVIGSAAIITGSVVVPLLLPYIPFRAFALKGALAGAATLLPFLLQTDRLYQGSIALAAGTTLFFTTVASYLALNFTGCTPFSNISGVKKEMRFAVPAYIAACSIGAALLVVFKLQEWGIV